MIRLLFAAGMLTLGLALSAQGSRTVNSGVFTVLQSERGELKYLRTCRECHERNLMGGGYDDIPPIKGEAFQSNWNSWSVADLYDFIESEMPPKDEDKVGISPEDYADMLAYILKENGYPAGDSELAPDFDTLAEFDMAPPLPP